MSDTAFPTFVHYGTHAERIAFTPSPPSSTQPLYTWYETDTNELYVYDSSWHGPYYAGTGSGTVTTTGSPVLGDLTAFSGASSITTAVLAGDVTNSGQTVTLANSGVTPGSYTNADITVDSKGRVTAASSGAGGGVTSVDSITGAISLVAGTNITITDNSPSAGDITIAASGSGGAPYGTQNGGFSYADLIPSSPNAMDDEFNGSSLDAKWTWVNQGAATATVGSGVLCIMAPASSSVSYRIIYQTLPATPYAFVAKVMILFPNSNYAHAGLYIFNSSSGKGIHFGQTEPITGYGIGVFTTNSPTSASASVKTYPYTGWGWVYLKLDDNGTTRTYSASMDGINFMTLYSEANTTWITPDSIGLIADSENISYPSYTSVDWFRRTA